MFSGNQPPTKRRTPHGSFNRTGIPQPSTSSSTSALIPPTRIEELGNHSEGEGLDQGVGSSNNLNQNNNNNDHAPSIPSASTSNLSSNMGVGSVLESIQVSYAYGAATSRTGGGGGSSSTTSTKKEIISNNNTINDLVQEDIGRSTRSRSRSLAPEGGKEGGNNEASSTKSPNSKSKKQLTRVQSRESSPTLSRTEAVVEITIPSDRRKTLNGAAPPRSSIPTSTINSTTNSRPIPGRNYPNGTSVNIATAFTQALENEAGASGSSSQIINPRGAGAGGSRENRDVAMSAAEEEEGDEEDGTKETQNTGGTGNGGDGNSKKRKVRILSDVIEDFKIRANVFFFHLIAETK